MSSCRASLRGHCDPGLMTRDASLVPVTLSRLSHVTLPGSGRGVAALYWRSTRHLPGSAAPNLPPWDSEPGQMYTRSHPANRQSRGAAERRGGWEPGLELQPSRERDWCWGRLSEESHSGLGAEKPGPYKEVLVRNGEKNGSIK